MSSLRLASLLGFLMILYLFLMVPVEYFVCYLRPYVSRSEVISFVPFRAIEQLLCDQDIGDHYDTTCIWSANYSLPFKAIWPLDTFKNLYSGFLAAFPLVIFSYTGHPFVMPLYVELARPSIRRMRKVYLRGYCIITVLYSSVSACSWFNVLNAIQ